MKIVVAIGLCIVLVVVASAIGKRLPISVYLVLFAGVVIYLRISQIIKAHSKAPLPAASKNLAEAEIAKMKWTK